jgi:hypothetical protein
VLSEWMMGMQDRGSGGRDIASLRDMVDSDGEVGMLWGYVAKCLED